MASVYEKLENLIRFQKSATFAIIAQKIIQHFFEDKQLLSQDELAKECFVSVSTISKFSQAIGYSGYKELYFELKREMELARFDNNSLSIQHIDIFEAVKNYIYLSKDKINLLTKLINEHSEINIFRSAQMSIAADYFLQLLVNRKKRPVIIDQSFQCFIDTDLVSDNSLNIVILCGRDNFSLIQNINRVVDKGKWFFISSERQFDKIESPTKNYLPLSFDIKKSEFHFRTLALQMIFFNIYQNI
ncbi:MurR/RpiR family transcriptional regulator [Mesoplasma florum]|uniref:hypothetical protein n=1 Tax=Mesoplasma florum TaxID=2151 RepID=UPI000D023259|nr:hypothetical protein [Mesoplasma florum]AVN59223.1 hypothetical protein CG009_03300 [Mesoplasma florum]